MTKRVAYAVIAALILFAAIRSAIATRTDGFTIDEAFHITAGVSYVKLGDFRINPEHPPLVKLWVGRALASAFRLPSLQPLSDKGAEREFTASTVYLDNNPDFVQARARAAMLILSSLLLAFFAVALMRTLGPAIAVATIGVLAIDPTIAAHMPVVMTDLSVALLAATGVLFTVAAFRSGSWIDTSLATVALGLTLGAKHSGVITVFAVGACALVALIAPRLFGTAQRRHTAIRFAVICAGSLLILWALYGFRYTETRTGEEAFNRPLTLKIEDVRSPSARRILALMAATHVVPRAYIWGLADTTRAGIEGRGIPVYFFGGKFRDRGPWYYFPTIIAAKLPIGLLLLAIAGILVVFVRTRSLPAIALAVLALLFLIALIRGVSYGGIRHALAIVVVLAVFAGIAVAFAFESKSRAARVGAAAALVIAMVSALPRIRPWEYFNELVGGPDGAYLRLGDEGVDVGQRDLDFVRYYRANLQPIGAVPYLFYPMSASEQQARGIRARGDRGTEAEETSSADVSGTFFVRASALFKNPHFEPFSHAHAARIGNLFVYKGTFHLPWLRERKLSSRAAKIMNSRHPDLAAAEALLREAVALNPQSFVPLLQSGNLMLRQRRREESLDFYRRALAALSGEDEPVMQAALTKQIARMRSAEPLENIRPVRGTRVE